MPVITRPDGNAVSGETEAAAILATLGLTVSRLPPGPSAVIEAVLERQSLDSRQEEAILAELAPHLPGDHVGQDVVALFPSSAGRATYHRCHVHDDDEIRLILAGEGVFGFTLPDGDQVEITVTPGDLIGVPAGAEHWFRLTGTGTIVALRLFGRHPDWRARFTDTPIRFPDSRIK